MKIQDGNTIREATPEEVLEYERIMQLLKENPVPKTNEQRIEELEQNQLDIAESIATLYEGGVA